MMRIHPERILKSVAHTLLSPLGVEIVRNLPVRSVELDLHQLIEFPIEHCLDPLGRPFSVGGGNHWVELLEQYSNDPSLSASQSSLQKYYTSFMIDDALDVLLSTSSSCLGDFRGAVRFCFDQNVLPWTSVAKIERCLARRESLCTQTRPHGEGKGGDYWGPRHSAKSIQEEFERTIGLFNNIRETGYRPWDFRDKYGLFPYPWGVILKKSTGLRFVVISGKHKLAALSVMGHRSVFVKPPPFMRYARDQIPTVIDFESADHWPCVRYGACTVREAQALFTAYFKS